MVENLYDVLNDVMCDAVENGIRDAVFARVCAWSGNCSSTERLLCSDEYEDNDRCLSFFRSGCVDSLL
jgi:hypothetical protein